GESEGGALGVAEGGQVATDADPRRFEEDAAVARALQQRRQRMRRHLAHLVVVDLERLRDGALDFQSPSVGVQLWDVEVAADVELLIRGEETIEGREGEL